jgi:hypothetical protein
VAAGATSLLGAPRALAVSDGIGTTWVGALDGVARVIAAARPFTLVGVSWTAPRPASIWLRTRTASGRWSRWAGASALGHEPDGPADRDRVFGDPIWSGPASYVQLRSSQPVAGVRLHFVSSDRGRLGARAHAAPAPAQPVLDAGPGQPPIIARSAWAHGSARHAVGPHFGTVELAFVHHSQTSNGYGAADVSGILRSIFDYHRYVRGFWDIGYNFAIDAFGRIWEARAGGIDKPVIGAHAGGYNAESTGVVVLGDFMNASPSTAAIQALQRLVAWKLSLHGIPAYGRVTVVVSPGSGFYSLFAPGSHVSLPRVAGHRDGDSTNCPGDVFYRELPSIRPRIRALAGIPVRVTLHGAPDSATAPAALQLSGTVQRLDGTPLAGVLVELQRIVPGGAITITTATTAADGTWSASATLAYSTLLRALHRPAPAAVSPVAQVAVAPMVTLRVSAGPPVQVSGTVAPTKPAVTIEVRRQGRLIKRKRVPVVGGQFGSTIAVAKPGDVLRATTAADALNADGASPPAAVPAA